MSDIHTIINHMQIWTIRYKGPPLHLPKMMKPKAVELKARIWSQIYNYEEFPQLITNLEASHVGVLKRMDVIVCTHVIPSIGTLTDVKEKNQVQLELYIYFDPLMSITTNANLQMSASTTHQYVAGSTALKTMMCMISNELDKGSKLVYMYPTEVRVHFQKDATMEYADTITDYQDWHHFANINHQEDVKELVFPQFSES